jgi:hypothetical protein
LSYDNDRKGIAMREKLFKAVLMLVALLVLPGLAWSQDAQQNLKLVVAGQPGQVPILQMNGKSYVDVDALARLTNSSLSFKGNQVILTPPGSAPSTPPADPEPLGPAGHLKLVAAEEKPADPEPSEPAGQAKPDATDQRPEAAVSEEAQAEALQKATQNPVANLISVPLQNNTNLSYGPYNRTQDVLNIQPVIPAHLGKKWLLISRIIQPIVWQPYPNQNTGGEYGLGDMNPSFFLSPAKPGKVIWGVGPAFVIPTATSTITGQGKLSIGPSFVALAQPKHWTIGALANNVWSVAGSGGRPPVNQFLLQYFVNYNMKKGWYLSVSPIITANWMASSGNIWTVPFGGGVGRIMKLGFQPVNISGEFYGNAVYPAGTSSWSMRLQLAFLFPKFTKEQEKMMLEMKLKQMEQEQQQAPPPKK